MIAELAEPRINSNVTRPFLARVVGSGNENNSKKEPYNRESTVHVQINVLLKNTIIQGASY